jgi:hypothetical protein
VVKYRSKIVSVQGYVRDPGQKILEGNASLTSVLAQAGSMTIDAGSYVIISRRDAKGAIEQIRVSRRDIETGLAQNVQLKDGDTVPSPRRKPSSSTARSAHRARHPGRRPIVERASGGRRDGTRRRHLDRSRREDHQEGQEDRPGPGQRHLRVGIEFSEPWPPAPPARDGREPLRRHRADVADDGLGTGGGLRARRRRQL